MTRESTKDLARTVFAGVVTALVTAYVLDSLAKAREAVAHNPRLPVPVAPGQGTA